uniref:Uncharacterized protein n=1 Tax=Arundo donax TaxID=35708 RepID=A0A0A9FCF4_ARUDO
MLVPKWVSVVGCWVTHLFCDLAREPLWRRRCRGASPLPCRPMLQHHLQCSLVDRRRGTLH